MKLIAKAVDAIAVFKGAGKPVPLKFRYYEDGGPAVEIKVERIIFSDEQRIAGQDSYIYECQSYIKGSLRRYQLKYVLAKAAWVLYKM